LGWARTEASCAAWRSEPTATAVWIVRRVNRYPIAPAALEISARVSAPLLVSMNRCL
jgi:hypothetical protein